MQKRIITGSILGLVAIAGLATSDGLIFRILYLVAGSMAVLEIVAAFIFGDSGFDNLIASCAGCLVLILELIVQVAAICIIMRSSSLTIFYIVFVACLSDILAYFIGKKFGRKHIKESPMPYISPKKSWEGILAGVFGTMMIMMVITLNTNYARLYLTHVTLLGGFIAVIGDMLGSLSKRILHIKDSGEIVRQKIPFFRHIETLLSSHGGFLDRLDSIALVAVFSAIIAHFTPTP